MGDIESYSTELGATQVSNWDEETRDYDKSIRPAEVVFVGAVASGLAQGAFDAFTNDLSESFDHNIRLAGSVVDMLNGVHELVSEDHGGFGAADQNAEGDVSVESGEE